MKPILDTFIETMIKKDAKSGWKDLVKPIGAFLYDQFYVYIWILCIYNVFFIFIVLANLFLLLKLVNSRDRPNFHFTMSE